MAIKYSRPKLYPKQEAAMFCAARFGLIEATTKAGKTISAIAWAIECCLNGTVGDNVWWVAPVHGQAVIAYRRIKNQLAKQGLYTTHDTNKTITFRNGAMLHFKSGEKPDNLYGDDVMALVVDEASRIREESWFALRSTITATRAPARIIGNVKGRRNWFYRLCRRAEQEMAAGSTEMHYARITAQDAVEAGVLDQEEIASAKADLPDAVFRELYFAEPSDDQGNPFGFEAIRSCIIPQLSTKKPVAWGWDLAKTMNWTVGIGLDEDGKVCRFVRLQGKVWGTIIEKIIAETDGIDALVDSTGVGDAVVDDLQEGRSNFSGYKFTNQSKQQLMEGLALVINRREIGYPSGVISEELEQFEYQVKRTSVIYSAPEGYEDDCVCALALAVKCRELFCGAGAWKRNALWSQETMANCRVPMIAVRNLTEKKAEFKKIEIGVTPPLLVTGEAGIIVVGLRHDGSSAVLDDYSAPGGSDWGANILDALQAWHADRIVCEPSFKGRLVATTLKLKKKNAPIKFVRASVGENIRAAPVAELYEKHSVLHAGRFPELERQLSLFSKTGYLGSHPPERASAAIWAISDMMLEPQHTYSLDNVN